MRRNGSVGKPGTIARSVTKPPATWSALGTPRSCRASSSPRGVSASSLATRVTRTPGRGREDERGDLGDEAVADGQETVALERVDDGHPLHGDADGEPAEDVDDDDDERGDDVALDELHGAVHRAVELALALRAARRRRRASLPSMVPAAELGVDGHLLAGHRVEHEPRADLGHALGALGDDDELDDRQDEEDDRADDVVPAHDERRRTRWMTSPALACRRMRRVDATLSDRRKSVVSRSSVGNVAMPRASGT